MFCLRTVPFEHQTSPLIFAPLDHTRLEIPQLLSVLTVDLLIFSEKPILLRICLVALSLSIFPMKQ